MVCFNNYAVTICLVFVAHAFGQESVYIQTTVFHIMKTCPCNIQRFISAAKIKKFFRIFLIFFLFLLKT